MTVALELSFALCCLGLAAAFARLVRGPSLPDRVVALDLMSMLMVGILVTAAVSSGEPNLLRAAIVIALLAFLGTVAFARYVERSISE